MRGILKVPVLRLWILTSLLTLRVCADAPKPLTFDNHQGKILMEISFGSKGEVVGSRVARSNAPYPLEVTTIEYVRSHWQFPLFAGETLLWPIVFDSASPLKWDDDLTPPPNLYPTMDLRRELTLRLTFGADGWITDASVLKASGDDANDRMTAIWLKAHWHHDAYAGKTIDAPFVFTHPAPAPPPSKPKPKPVAAPVEPAPIPAMRVQ